MKCKEVQYKLNAYLDQELNEKDQAILTQHLLDCHECQSELHQLKALNHQLNVVFDDPLDEDLLNDLLQRSRFIQVNQHSLRNKVVSFASMFLAVIMGTYFSNVTFTQNSYTKNSTVSDSIQTYYDQQTLYAALEEVTQ